MPEIFDSRPLIDGDVRVPAKSTNHPVLDRAVVVLISDDVGQSKSASSFRHCAHT
jgi:hypothetical protein